MGKIHILDKHVAELIAAGEVVERPASVVKELLENAIDAGASAVTVEIKRGGVSYIRVSDNGCGIEAEDIRPAFVRHATSKVKDADDLERIGTLGFRGEALASVASVARVELYSRIENAAFGNRICIEGGSESLFDVYGCPRGTTIVVKDLFYNTPARMKFLKKDVTEGNAVANVVEKAALSHPGLSLRLIRDGRETMHTPGNGDLLSTVYAVYGKDFAASLLPVQFEKDGFALRGFLSKPAVSRSNRMMQNFFINGRFVKSRTCQTALEEAYKNSVMVGKFPACVLDLQIPFELVDVNVHPAKIEVRFVNEKPVFDLVYFGAKEALHARDERPELALPVQKAAKFPVMARDTAAEQMQFSSAEKSSHMPGNAEQQERFARSGIGKYLMPENEEPLPLHSPAIQAAPAVSKPSVPQAAAGSAARRRLIEQLKAEWNPGETSADAQNADLIPSYTIRKHSAEQEKTPPCETAAAPQPDCIAEEERPARRTDNWKVLCEAFETYVFVQYGEELLIIDKHAAHERHLFEQLKAQAGNYKRQLLLAPVTLAVSPPEYQALTDHTQLLEQLGFVVEGFGENTVVVREVPLVLAEENAEQLLYEIAEKLLANQKDFTPDCLEDLYHSIACRSAIKAHDKSSIPELERLVEECIEQEDIRYCPHGRPVAVRLTKSELEKKFGRI